MHQNHQLNAFLALKWTACLMHFNSFLCNGMRCSFLSLERKAIFGQFSHGSLSLRNHQMPQTLTGHWKWNNMPTSTNVLLHILVSTAFFDIVMLAWRQAAFTWVSNLDEAHTHTHTSVCRNRKCWTNESQQENSRQQELWEPRTEILFHVRKHKYCEFPWNYSKK